MGVARKAERAQYGKELLNLVLTEHTKIVSKVEAKIKDPIINTTRIDADKCLVAKENGKESPI